MVRGRTLLHSLLAVVAAVTAAAALEQQPLAAVNDAKTNVASDILDKLKTAEIIPTVLDPFDPKLTISVSWPDDITADLGNSLDPSDTQKAPKVHFSNAAPDVLSLDSMQLTIAMTDPDAPSRDNPEWSEIAHWVATNVPLKDATASSNFKDVIEYKPPGPPPKTGKHRYVFAALVPRNGTTDSLHLSKPKDRKHWGYGKKRQGLRKWAEENGLVVVGANFIYEQNEEQ